MRTSWVPWIIMLPFGMIPVTTAAIVRLIFSERLIWPAPALELVELVSMAFAGSKPPGRTLPRVLSRPRKCGTPAFVPEVRELLVALVVLALSSMSMLTVRMSPTRLARWSLKKARAPVRHSELALAACGAGSRAEMNCCVCGTRAAG